MDIKEVHCLFEQSGTFKNEFKKLGVDAYDYDILNNFGETDYQMDLFAEINKAYEGDKSIFDNFIGGGKLVMAFYPCVRFENQAKLWFRGENYAQKNWTDEQKLECNKTFFAELASLYELVTKLAIVCLRRNIRMIIENPYSSHHTLTVYWCLKPQIIDIDRRRNGDYYAKPTQFWFINSEPEKNILTEAIPDNAIFRNDIECVKKGVSGATTDKEARSMIAPAYANRFIRQFILNEKGEQ